MNQKMDNRRRIGVVRLAIIVGMLPLSGCAHNQSVEGIIPDRMRFSQSPETTSSVRSLPQKTAIPAVPPSHAAERATASKSVQSYSGRENYITQSPPHFNQPEAVVLAETDRLNPPSIPAFPLAHSVKDSNAPIPKQNVEYQPTESQLTIAKVEKSRESRQLTRTVVHANDSTFSRVVLNSDSPVLVDFYASWCGPCKKLAPTLEEVATEYPQAKIVKVDIDESPEIAARYGIRSVPSLVIFKEGQPVAKEKGVIGKARLLSMLDL